MAGTFDIASTNKAMAQERSVQESSVQELSVQKLSSREISGAVHSGPLHSGQLPNSQAMQKRELNAAEAAAQFDRCFKDASEALRNGRYGDAERLYRKAIILAGRFGESDKRYGKAFGDLGRLLTMRARFDEAEPLLEEELHSIKCREHFRSSGGGAQGSGQSTSFNSDDSRSGSVASAGTERSSIADLSPGTERSSSADSSSGTAANTGIAARSAADIGITANTGTGAVAQSDYKELIPAMSSLASFYLNYGSESKAEPLASELLSLIDGRLGEYREATSGKIILKNGQPLTGWAGSAASTMTNPVVEWAIALDAVAGDLRNKGKLDMAERCYNVALEVKETVLGKEHLSLANSFDSLAAISQERGDMRQAEQYYSYALETTERILPKSNPQVYSRLDRLAKCLLKENKLAEAEALYLKAQSFWEENSRNGSEARAAYALGNVYMLEKKYQEAQPYLANALKLAEEFYGPDSIALVPFLNRYADLLYYQGQDGPRQELKARACAISGTPL
jgi:tetratricopeptide (TPR) repeat protein